MIFDKLIRINNSKSILIVSDNSYHRFLSLKSKYEVKHKMLFLFKVIKESELLEMLTFSYEPNLLLALNKDQVNLDGSKELIKISRFDINQKLSQTTNFLIRYQKYLVKNDNFITYLKKKYLYFLKDYKQYQSLLNYHQLDFDNIDIKFTNNPIVKQFSTNDDEYLYLFESIANIIKSDVDINNVKLANVDSSSVNKLKKYAHMYNLNINFNSDTFYYDLALTRILLENDYFVIINESDKLKDFVDTFEITNIKLLETVINFFINFFNTYLVNNNYSDLTDLLVETLKTTKYQTPKMIDAIEIINVEEVMFLESDDVLFVVDSYYEHFPSLKKDNDVISDVNKFNIGMLRSFEENELNNHHYENLIKHPQIKYISFSKTDNYQEFQASDVISPYIINKKAFSKLLINDLTYNFASNLYKTSFKTKNKESLRTTFNGLFLLDNDEESNLIRFIRNANLKLSPTSVTSYLKLPFIYYVNQILKISNFNENVYLYSGNFFHTYVEYALALFYPEHVILDEKIDDIDKESVISYGKVDLNLLFDQIFNKFFKNELLIVNYYNINSEENPSFDKLSVESVFFIRKNKDKMVKAVEFLIDLNETIPPSQILLEYRLATDDFYGRADFVKINQDDYANTFTIIDYKTSSKTAVLKEKLFDFLKLVNEDYDARVDEDAISVIQVLLYAYMMELKMPDYQMLDASYFGYLEDDLKLNAIMTQELPKTFYTGGKRIISQEDISELALLLENLIFSTKQNVYDAKFDISLRKSTKGKNKLNFSDFNDYHAIAYFNKYEVKVDDLEGDDDE